MAAQHTSLPNHTALRRALVAEFSVDDLAVLCGDVRQALAANGVTLALSLDIVGGQGQEKIAQNLIEYLDHRGGYAVLVAEVCKARPQFTPGDFYFTPHNPDHPLTRYRLRILQEAHSRAHLYVARRFVHLTLEKSDDAQGMAMQTQPRTFDDLREVLANTASPMLIVLGRPGAGKSTLLHRLGFDTAQEGLQDADVRVPFIVPLNDYPLKDPPAPRDWLARKWRDEFGDMLELDALRRDGRLLLLLDALNELRHNSRDDFNERVNAWRDDLDDFTACGNLVVITCRELDSGWTFGLGDAEVARVLPLSREQMQEFLRVYKPAQAEALWNELKGDDKQISLYSTPYYLDLLTRQITPDGKPPRGRAALFTGFVRNALMRELQARKPLFDDAALLDERDKDGMRQRNPPHWLPENGLLIRKLCDLAFGMQRSGLRGEGGESSQVRAREDEALAIIAHPRAADVLRAAAQLGVLDEQALVNGDVLFAHQLMQEYFAARTLARQPDPSLLRTEWREGTITPAHDEVMRDRSRLPPEPSTGWEETAQMAAAMTSDQDAFVRALAAENLPRAALCAAARDVTVKPETKRQLQGALLARMHDRGADIRARIAAGEALGELDDPRFELHTGAHGAYLMPPLVPIKADTYHIGSDDSDQPNEKPEHTVELSPFQIAKFPVTNAEYKCFVDAKGYEQEQWWESDEARAWLKGDASAVESLWQDWRSYHQRLKQTEEDVILRRAREGYYGDIEPDELLAFRSMSESELDEELRKRFRSGQVQTQPSFWEDTRFNNLVQPVVGISWHEARAYCKWLSAQTYLNFRLPTEAEWEATARGPSSSSGSQREYAYGPIFDPKKCNTLESRILRTTPVGLFIAGETPEGAADLCGNVWQWCADWYDAEEYRRRASALVRDPQGPVSGTYRVLRGGSWLSTQDNARAAYRGRGLPVDRDANIGFRLVSVPVPRL